MSQGGNCEIDGKFDGEDFQSLLSAMQVLGFTSDEQDTIFRILASGKLTHIVIMATV
jgi:myosin-15